MIDKHSFRSYGILHHISSIESVCFNGDLGLSSYEFIDKIAEIGCRWWQILPYNPIGFGNSPYDSVSSFAGEPLFIDLNYFVKSNLIKSIDIPKNKNIFIDYISSYKYRYAILKKAYSNLNSCFFKKKEFKDFYEKNRYWLDDYSSFLILKEINKDKWYNWPDEIKYHSNNLINKVYKNYNEKFNFYLFLQYLFYKQFDKLKKYANDKKISIIGDLPIYTALDSVDVWSNSNLFLLDRYKNPKYVSGVPPDKLSKSGQKWSTALYDWNAMEANNYDWWINRIGLILKNVNYIRLDHFIGFKRFWKIPLDADPKEGQWIDVNGENFFKKVLSIYKNSSFIAEDLGVVDEQIMSFRKNLNISGMKVFQFAFEDDYHNPDKCNKNSVLYTSTHDNDTLRGWFENIKKNNNLVYKKLKKHENNIYEYLIKYVSSSPANILIFPSQDILWLESKYRMNIPGTSKNNWIYKISNKYFNYDKIKIFINIMKSSKRF